MAKTIRSLSPVFLIFLFFAIIPGKALAQSAGDIAFTVFNGDDNDGFAVVALKDFPDGTVIHFSNEEWDGSSFSGSGGHLDWNAPSGGISAGTVLAFTSVEATPSVNVGTITNDSNINLSGSGDVIYAYTGTDQSTPDTPFLGAIATAADEYSGGAGTLTNTGLTQGSTAILLDDNIDNAQYIGDRSGDTKNGYLTKLNVINGETATDDNWDQYNGSAVAPFPPFDTTNFVIVNAPTLEFLAPADTVAENAGTYTLTVKLAEANGTAVSVDVAFLSGSSSARASDIGNYTTQTVSFTSGASSGDTKTVTVNITDNSSFDGNKRAVFRLQNNTTGSIIDPSVLNLLITDDELPPVVINEFLADPDATNGDANGDGTVNTGDDEFIEIVNNGSSDIDITGWQLSDNGTDIRYTFPSGTVLPGNGAAVVFSGGTPTGNFGGAIVLVAGGTLSLNNGGDDPTLFNDKGTVVQTVSYGSEGGDNQSLTRDPDITGNFVKHSTATGSGDRLFSPGTKVDGTAFGSTYAIGIRGQEGWRFIATPTASTSFDDLFSNIWTQGIPGSDASSASAANIYSWNESGGGTFATISGMTNTMTAGQGYIVYVYQDDDFRTPGIQGGFPKVLSTDNSENSSPVSVAVSSHDNGGSAGIDGNEGYNLLGNPYGTDISVDAVISALESVNSSVNNNVYIWDPNAGSGDGGYATLSSGTIAPFQAFFIRYTADGVSGNASFDRSNLAANTGAQFYGKAGESEQAPITFDMHLSNGHKFDTYQVRFDKNGTVGEDRWDAYKLFSLNADPISLYSTVGDGVKLAKNVLPELSSLKGELKVPLGYDVPASGKYTYSWSSLEDIPQNMEVYLIDHKTGEKIDMKIQDTYQFTIAGEEQSKATIVKKGLTPLLTQANDGNSISSDEDTPRFELSVVPTASEKQPEDPSQKDVVLSPNYPNPFSSQTTMNLQLKKSTHVTMTIYNIVAQKVATIVDKTMPQGEYPMTWNVPANMPSGIYICRVDAGGKIITQKMTLIK